MISDRKRHCRGEQPIAAVNRRIVCVFDFTKRAADNLTGERPVPVLAMPAHAEAADVKVGIGYQWRVVFAGRGFLAEEVPGADKVTFAQLAGGPGFIKETRIPIQW